MNYQILSDTNFLLGIAANSMLAKVCSDKNKPNGQFCVPFTKEAVMEFVNNLPIRKVFNRKSQDKLVAF